MQINNYFRFKTDITYFCQNSEEVKLTYEVSINICEQSLFPAVRVAKTNTTLAANGTNCRHQIKDGKQKYALHPITILRKPLI
ncbi:hypothetical protein [Kordia sp.]|uniref:hypothetical protein n=1 Tax=Kordia sp. TaxID=1965332 RepID=UPI003B5AD5AF